MLLVSLIPEAHSVSLYTQPLSSYRRLCAPWDSKNDIEHYKVNIRYHIYNYALSQISNSFSLQLAVSRDTIHFETSEPKDTHMTVNITKTKVAQI